MDGKEVVARLANAFSKQIFPDAPRLVTNSASVNIVPSEVSYLVQASDVLGNFVFAHASSALGLKTTGRVRKSIIFERVFGQ